jgi:hypothetical protein
MFDKAQDLPNHLTTGGIIEFIEVLTENRPEMCGDC